MLNSQPYLSTTHHFIKLLGLLLLPLVSQAQEAATDSLPVKTGKLQQVEIIGRKANSYKSDYTFGATRTATWVKDIPQSVTIVTKELMADRQVDKVWDVTKLMSGVNRFSSYNDIVMRGFRSGENQPRLINGMRAAFGFFDQPVTTNIERIEVIKGPVSALYGNAVPGGSINLVTKKPLEEERYGINFSTGSFNTYRASADFTGPLNKDKTVLYRLNVGYSNAESFRSLQFAESYMIAPSVTFIPTSKTRLNIDLVYSNTNTRIDRGQPIFGATSQTDIYATPISLALGAANDYYKVKNLQLSASLSHAFTDNVAINISAMRFGWDEALLEHRTTNLYAVDGDGKEIPTLMGMQVFDRLQKMYSDNVNMYTTWKSNPGNLQQTLLIGYDYIRQERPDGGAQNTARGYRNAANDGVIVTYNPANKTAYLLDKDGNPVPNVPYFDLQQIQYPIRNTSNYFFSSTLFNASRFNIHALYAQEQLVYHKFQLLLGVRQEWYTDYENFKQTTQQKITQHAFIPRVGLVYTITPLINVYGTYTQGYQPQSASTFSNPNYGGPFSPSTSNMIEAGAKGGFFDDKLAVNMAIYRIIQKNMLVNALDPVNPDLLRQRGKEESKGIEVEAVGNILPDLAVNINYAYNEAIIKEGLPKEIGRQKENAPKHLANAWVKYSISKGTLKGFGAGTGFNYTGIRNTQVASLQLPAFTTVDAALYYTYNKMRVSLNCNNLFDQVHWVGGYDYTRLFPGTPRNMMLSIAKLF